MSKIQQTFSAKGSFSTQEVRDLIINMGWRFKFIVGSCGSFWALSAFETSQQCLWEILNEFLWAGQRPRLWVKHSCPGDRTDTPTKSSKLDLSNPASTHHRTAHAVPPPGLLAIVHGPQPLPCSSVGQTLHLDSIHFQGHHTHSKHCLQQWLPKKVSYLIIESQDGLGWKGP